MLLECIILLCVMSFFMLLLLFYVLCLSCSIDTSSLCANKEIYIYSNNINKKTIKKCNNKKSRIFLMNLK